MKSLFFVPFAAVSLIAISRAGPNERAILAAMKLSERPNYTWVSTISDDARTYDIEGKTSNHGYTWMRLPMVKAIAQRLGREAESDLEAYFRTSESFVIRTERGWKTLKELPKRNWEWNDDFEFWPSPPGARANLAAAALAGLDPLEAPPFPPPYVVMPPMDDEEKRPYCNAQFALCHPHDELAVIVSSYTDLKVSGDVAIGTLSDLGAQLLLVREGQDHLKPLAAAGTFKLLMNGGVVTRFQIRLEGILLVDRRKIYVRQDETTTLRNIGSTTLAVPDEARRKLER